MDVIQVEQIIRDEKLFGYVWFDQPLRPNSIVIRHEEESSWKLFYTDERATPWPNSGHEYPSEAALLEDFIARLRREKIDAQIDRQLFS